MGGKGKVKKYEEVGPKPQNPGKCGSGLPPECFYLKNGECIANQQCYSIKCYADMMSFEFKKELIFQEKNKDLNWRENFSDNFFVKIGDEFVRGNCQNGTFYRTREESPFDIHFIAGYENKCSKIINGNGITSQV